MDSETCSLHGPVVTIQHLFKGQVRIEHVWLQSCRDTLKAIEDIVNSHYVGFNVPFDWFHLQQTYNVLRWLDPSQPPSIGKYYELEGSDKVLDGVVLKPRSCLDLMLTCRKGLYQGTMERESIRIKRVHKTLAPLLADELTRRIDLSDIYFSRKKDKKQRFVVKTPDDLEGTDFVNVELDFAPSGGLKAIWADIFGDDEGLRFDTVAKDLPMPEVDIGYRPYGGDWPNVIRDHINFWATNKDAQKYMRLDVIKLEQLHRYLSCEDVELALSDKPIELIPQDDVDSQLAICVGSVRQRGLRVDVPKLTALRQEAVDKITAARSDYGKPAAARTYLRSAMSDTEAMVLEDGTGKIILEAISKWRLGNICEACQGLGCDKCKDGLVLTNEPHPAAKRAKEVLEYRRAVKSIELLDKLILAGRFHASFKVIGALSGRMSGADGLNPQGITRDKKTRSCFPLAWPGMQLDGGDWSGFEVSIADAVYNDPALRRDMLTLRPCDSCCKKHLKAGHVLRAPTGAFEKNGQVLYTDPGFDPIPGCEDCQGTGYELSKIHAIFGQFLFPPMTYDEILATKGKPGEEDKYSRSKNGVFALIYGGETHTLVTRVGVPEEVAQLAFNGFCNKYTTWKAKRQLIVDRFCSAKQNGGIGSRIEWSDPADYAETLTGFKRFFTLENKIAKVLFELAESPPKEWLRLNIKVRRNDRIQTAGNAARSALFGCMFGVMSGNMRAAANHEIQGTGAEFTKRPQARIWRELQPQGIHPWHVMPINIHDEIMCPVLPELSSELERIIRDEEVKVQAVIPLARMDWGKNIKNWSEK